MAATTFLGTTALVSPAEAAVKGLQAKSSTASAQSVRAFVVRASAEEKNTRRQLIGLAATLVAGAAVTGKANAADLVSELLAKSAANKALNDKKRLVTSGANVSRAYTVTFETCKFPENFVGCEDLANIKKVPFLTEDHEIECKGKDAYKCASNSHWTGAK
eukprot:TRINITY_DN20218_c0_g1_i1.p2 TRINITY_DN20218_c0_g1~~TRINITY_DN20218_c0_g1_i1.p2  ORF type:complete len:161 (+),score=36.78 TRINITY_DN20218_c0_g1_i1:216-698(+)